MLSITFPICNRAQLFKETLKSMTIQTLPPDEYEIIVIDDGGTEPELKTILRTFRAHGLNIRYAKIDVCRLPFEVYQHNGLFNDPGPAMNVAIKLATGDRIVLTSPEVQHQQRTNLERMDSWPLDPNEALICDVYDPGLKHDPVLRGMIGGGPLQRPLHFLGVYYRDLLLEMGGFEEEFVIGWGAQDCEFAERFRRKWNGQFVFTGPAVRGYHQPHPRVENESKAGVQANADLCERLILDPDYRVANVGREWGSRDLIVEEEWLE